MTVFLHLGVGAGAHPRPADPGVDGRGITASGALRDRSSCRRRQAVDQRCWTSHQLVGAGVARLTRRMGARPPRRRHPADPGRSFRALAITPPDPHTTCRSGSAPAQRSRRPEWERVAGWAALCGIFGLAEPAIAGGYTTHGSAGTSGSGLEQADAQGHHPDRQQQRGQVDQVNQPVGSFRLGGEHRQEEAE